jgi:hypothetical protein
LGKSWKIFKENSREKIKFSSQENPQEKPRFIHQPQKPSKRKFLLILK